MMQSGRLRETINIQQKNTVVSEAGEQVVTWSTFKSSIRAEIQTPTGREFFAHDKLNAQVSHVVKTRWIDGVLPEMRILWGTRILNIEYISEDRKHAREKWIYCKEVRDNG